MTTRNDTDSTPKPRPEAKASKVKNSARKASPAQSTTGRPIRTDGRSRRPQIPPDDPIFKAGWQIGEKRLKPLSKRTPAKS